MIIDVTHPREGYLDLFEPEEAFALIGESK